MTGKRRLRPDLDKKQDSFYQLLKVPKKPEVRNRRSSAGTGVAARRKRSVSEPRGVRKTIATVTEGVKNLGSKVFNGGAKKASKV